MGQKIGHKHSEETKKKLSSLKVGEKNPRFGKTPWNKGLGTKTSESKKIRESKEYKLWRKAVYERDNYTCIWCNQRGGELAADHIKPFALFPELRFAIDNGRTLCRKCHLKTDTFGWKSYHNKKQIYG